MNYRKLSIGILLWGLGSPAGSTNIWRGWAVAQGGPTFKDGIHWGASAHDEFRRLSEVVRSASISCVDFLNRPSSERSCETIIKNNDVIVIAVGINRRIHQRSSVL
jgi:hypothetical protein